MQYINEIFGNNIKKFNWRKYIEKDNKDLKYNFLYNYYDFFYFWMFKTKN